MAQILGSPLPGFDEAWDRATVQEIINAGGKFVCRYLSYDHTGKNLSVAEARELAAAGLWIVTVWEYDPHAPLQGRTQGITDAMAAAIQAGIVGQPKESVIYFAVDFDASASQYPVIGAYLQGADTVLREHGYIAGVYCGYDLGKWLLDNGYIRDLWQTYAWSRNRFDSRALVRQTVNGHNLAGHDVDEDQAEYAWYGQWQPNVAPPTEGHDAMNLSDEVPGTGIPGHPGNKLVQDILMDLASLREMLVTGTEKPPVDSPLATLLGLSARLTAIQGSLSTLLTATNAIMAALDRNDTHPQGSADDTAVVDQLRRIADALASPTAPPATPEQEPATPVGPQP